MNKMNENTKNKMKKATAGLMMAGATLGLSYRKRH